MTQLLSPAGSPEAVIAAVQNGADAIYLGIGEFNARRGAKNFTDEEFEKAVRYCRVRGCQVYVTLNTLVSDREIDEAMRIATMASRLGADGLIVQDLGLVRLLRACLPDIPVHASTQMSIHNLPGVEAASDMGASCAVLARELSGEQIRFITEKASIPTEVFVHGALCFCHSGQCYMSALIGKRSGNRGMCAQPCRQKYSLGGRMDDYPLSLKDSCLAGKVGELKKAGVEWLKIEGRAKRPEYTAVVTGIYSKLLKENREPTAEEMEMLERTFSRNGFTQGYYNGDKQDMFGIRGEAEPDNEKFYAGIRKSYSDGELRRVPVHFLTLCQTGKPIMAIAYDDDGNKAVASGPIPEKARNGGLTATFIEEQMFKTGGTPYYCIENKAQVDQGLHLPASVINELRRNLISNLTVQRESVKERRELPRPVRPDDVPVVSGPVKIFQVLTAEQLTPELAAFKPEYVYVPVMVMADEFDRLRPFIDNGTKPVAVLPRIITDDEIPIVYRALEKLFDLGINEALVGNIGHIIIARRAGMKIRADFGLNAYNSYTLGVLKDIGFLSATVSFELRLPAIADMAKPLDTEMIVYGRLPLMVSDQCVISRSAGHCNCQVPTALTDKKGMMFPVVKEFGCRNVIYNGHKLWLSDKQDDVYSSGIWGQRMIFSNESPRECVEVVKGYFGMSEYAPNVLTRGLYYRGVE